MRYINQFSRPLLCLMSNYVTEFGVCSFCVYHQVLKLLSAAHPHTDWVRVHQVQAQNILFYFARAKGEQHLALLCEQHANDGRWCTHPPTHAHTRSYCWKLNFIEEQIYFGVALHTHTHTSSSRQILYIQILHYKSLK